MDTTAVSQIVDLARDLSMPARDLIVLWMGLKFMTHLLGYTFGAYVIWKIVWVFERYFHERTLIHAVDEAKGDRWHASPADLRKACTLITRHWYDNPPTSASS